MIPTRSKKGQVQTDLNRTANHYIKINPISRNSSLDMGFFHVTDFPNIQFPFTEKNGPVAFVRCDGRNSFPCVSILVVVEDGLVLSFRKLLLKDRNSLNPCCSGRWSRTMPCISSIMKRSNCLNPCCSGQWSRTRPYKTLLIINKLKNFPK